MHFCQSDIVFLFLFLSLSLSLSTHFLVNVGLLYTKTVMFFNSFFLAKSVSNCSNVVLTCIIGSGGYFRNRTDKRNIPYAVRIKTWEPGMTCTYCVL